MRKGITALFLTAVSLLVGGCRIHKIYAYEPGAVQVLSGSLHAAIQGTYTNYEEGGKRYAKLGQPYLLGFTFLRPPHAPFSTFEIKDLTITGVSTGTVLDLGHAASTNVVDRGTLNGSDDRLEVNVGFQIPTDTDLTYEDVKVEAIVRVRSPDGSISEHPVKMLLKTEYRKSRRSDWFDEAMSI